MMNFTSEQKPFQLRNPNYRSKSSTPKVHYNGIHNYQVLRIRMTIDNIFSSSITKRPITSTSRHQRRYSIPTAQLTSPSSININPPSSNRYTSIDNYFCPSEYVHSFFPSRHKYTKGKKKPIAVKMSEFIDEQALSKNLQHELKAREQKKKLQTDQKFQKIKQKYAQISNNRKSAIKYIQKPKTAHQKIKKRESKDALVISPWDNQIQEIGL